MKPSKKNRQTAGYRGAATRRLLAVLLLGWLGGAFAEGAERATAEASDTLVAVFPERFPPVFEVTSNGVPAGFGIDVMEAVAAQAGIKVIYRSVPDWSSAFAALRSGKADLIPNLGITDTRRQFVDFTRPVESEPLRLYVRNTPTAPASLSDFRGSRRMIAVVTENAAGQLLNRQGGFQVREYLHLVDALLALIEGQVDGLVYPQAMLDALISRLGLKGQVKAVDEPLLVIDRAIAIAKWRGAMLDRIDAALEAVMHKPLYAQIYNRWHSREPPFWNTQRVGYLAAALLTLGLFAVILVRVRGLSRLNAELAQARTFTEAILDAAMEGVFTMDDAGVIRSVNRSTERIFLRTADELLGAPIATVLPLAEADQLVSHLGAIAVGPGREWLHKGDFSEYQALRRDGELFPIRMAVVALQDAGERLYVCTVQDISQQRAAERQASYYADHDPLTGMLNQQGAMLVLENLLAQARRYGRSLGCLNFGVDRLSYVNDVHGRQRGDQVLSDVAECLRETLRNSDVLGRGDDFILARAGGDRFLAILPEVDEKGAQRAAERVLATIDQYPFRSGEVALHINCRAGIAVFPEHGDSAQVLLSHAETALRLAKQPAMPPIRMYSLNDQVEERLVEHWVERIRQGLRDDRFELLFQPIQHIASSGIHHYETLVRYRDEAGALIPPGTFIPIAERFGLIRRLDLRVLELAISYLAGLEAAGQDVSLSINISGSHIGDGDLFLWMERLVEERAVDPSHIIIEITETAAMHNLLRARAFVESLRALGFRIALDDFGVGFSSFSHLRNLPVDIVKIDGSFVRHLVDNAEDRVLVKSLTDIAHSLGKEVIAEFVCSEQIMELVSGYGVDYAQGYFVGKPRPLEDQIAH